MKKNKIINITNSKSIVKIKEESQKIRPAKPSTNPKGSVNNGK